MFRFAPLIVAAAGKHIDLDWNDCGSSSAHAKITALVPTPDPLPLGFDNPGKIAATATLDKTETGGNYNIVVKVLGKTIVDETADFCKPFSFDMKFLGVKVGHADIEALDCPAAAGQITFNLGLALTSVVPAGVGGATISLTGTDSDSEELTCLNIDAKINTDSLESSARGACTADDISKIGALPQDTSDDSFPGKSAACGKKAYSLISGFDTEKFDTCLMGDVAISHDCADCYAQAGKYSAANCKADCLLGWCKSGCLTCSKSAADAAATCAGVPSATIAPCDDLEVSAGGACTADDISKIGALPQDNSDGSFGGKSAACGKKAYSLVSGFDTEKFDSCLMGDIAVSHDCADCYAQAGKYSAANCKADCLLGWCKSGCLTCSKSAADTAATCAGVPSATITPCEEMTV